MGAENTGSETVLALEKLAALNSSCERCPLLAEHRSSVVFGAGSPDAGVMFVGEAPGASEDIEGKPFVGASGKLLDGLLEGIGMSRADVFITSVLKCRPPDNRDPKPDEIRNCSPWLEQQIEIIRPSVLVTLGNYATRLLRGSNEGIGRVHGCEEIVQLGELHVRLYPVFHPAAALYRRPNLAVLEEDFARIPELVAMGPPEQPEAPEGDAGVTSGDSGNNAATSDAGRASPSGGETGPGATAAGPRTGKDQLGLF